MKIYYENKEFCKNQIISSNCSNFFKKCGNGWKYKISESSYYFLIRKLSKKCNSATKVQ